MMMKKITTKGEKMERIKRYLREKRKARFLKRLKRLRRRNSKKSAAEYRSKDENRSREFRFKYQQK
jgi:hypothetical protein